MWQPTASRDALLARQRLYQTIRRYFSEQDVTEVETPYLSQASVCDPNIEPMQTLDQRYLHTSPEYAMKRLLCAGYGDIFQIARVFRRGEAGHRHNPEFSMLEWYRVGWDDQRLMQEVAALTRLMLAPGYAQLPVEHLQYAEALSRYAGVNVFTATDSDIAAAGRQLAGQDLQLSRDGWLDIIMSHAVEPALSKDTLVFIDEFPASQAAMAKVTANDSGQPVARRFELYFNGAELANGYYELTDADEQRRRFEAEADGRPLDERLLNALQHGMPACAGVAMGLDRLLMTLLNTDSIADVLAFDWGRA
ncbi:MAG: EF-P lysine aminoacylase GenX [Oceanospirillaceae bacterium]|nr:EF-P lysine aminoacylase GenX [Oceanospirillaceae bacterium]MBT10707.1 EF-P lysine aminoacylase GenX [Oceanospirillaceae bacterium]|tara:strand:- start:30994 stop:31914 length:921 start_codon:yes stop_codon:yes gene_type:complete